MANHRVATVAAEALGEPVDAVVAGMLRSRWFWPVLVAGSALAVAALTVADTGWPMALVLALLTVCATSLTQRSVYLARTATRTALVRGRRGAVRASRPTVVDPATITIGSAGLLMASFTVNGITYLIPRRELDGLADVLDRS
jgi:hypothetical protein